VSCHKANPSDSLTRECLVEDLYVILIHSVLGRGLMGNSSCHYTTCDNNPILNAVYPHHCAVVGYVIKIEKKIFVEFEVHTAVCVRIGGFWV
jgi:hypothetical protein